MKATSLYRIASVLLLVAAAGNTFFAVNFWRFAGSTSPVLFPFGHTGLTYAQMVVDLELFCSLCVVFGAYLAWRLGALARTTPQAIGALGWVLFAYQLVGIGISFMFLSGLVRILFVCIAICLGPANWSSRGALRAPAAAR
jgi:hypothetical protein